MSLGHFKKRRIFLKSSVQIGTELNLSPEDSYHFASVLRLKAGDTIVAIDSQKSAFEAIILNADPRLTNIKITSAIDHMPNGYSSNTLQVYLALMKADALELAIQKLVELGVDSIKIFKSERSLKMPTDKIESKIERWKRIISQAAGQSEQSHICDITFQMDNIIAPTSEREMVIVLEARQHQLSLYDHLKTAFSDSKAQRCISLVIGPEGGFSAKELKCYSDKGFVLASLGKSVLKAETAAICATFLLTTLLLDDNLWSGNPFKSRS